MKKSTKGDEYVFCTFCRQDLKIASSGANDIARHLQKQKHQENEKAELAATKGSHKITSFVKKSDDCERVFSIVGKKKTKQRANLSTQTLSSLLTRKLSMQNRNVKCYDSTYSDQLLKKAKSSTYQTLQASTSAN